MPNLPWTKNSVAILTLIGACDLQQIVNVHHFEASGVQEASFASDVLAQAWGGQLADDWITNLKSLWLLAHTNDYTLSMVRCQVIERPSQFRHKLTPTDRPQTTSNVGTQSAAADMLQVAVNIKWQTPQAGKSHRGRTYIGPLQAQTGSSGRLGTGLGFQDSYKNYADAMIARYGAIAGTQKANYLLTIYSRPYNQGEYQYATRKTGTMTVETPVDYAGNSTNVTVATVDPILRTQRRRVLNVGS